MKKWREMEVVAEVGVGVCVSEVRVCLCEKWCVLERE